MLIRAVRRELFITPNYEEFKQQIVWLLKNTFTTAFEQLKSVQQYQATARLGKFLQPYTAAF